MATSALKYYVTVVILLIYHSTTFGIPYFKFFDKLKITFGSKLEYKICMFFFFWLTTMGTRCIGLSYAIIKHQIWVSVIYMCLLHSLWVSLYSKLAVTNLHKYHHFIVSLNSVYLWFHWPFLPQLPFFCFRPFLYPHITI